MDKIEDQLKELTERIIKLEEFNKMLVIKIINPDKKLNPIYKGGKIR